MEHHNHQHHHQVSENNGGNDIYYCPMHPYITKKEPGNCPECGMKLEKMVKDSSEHKYGHGKMVDDFKKRFWITLIITIPVILLSPMIQHWFHFNLSFTGSTYLLFTLSTVVFIYGGSPFLKGLVGELKNGAPGMMTLIGVAISVAYIYSVATVFGLQGMDFFWELCTLILIMLLGHWLEMKSVAGASRELELLVQLMPSVAHMVHGEHIMDVKTDSLKEGDLILIKPGENIAADGNQSLVFALERMVTVIVICCPHALGLAVPLVVAISTSLSAKNGLLIKNRTAFENARKITTIIFDKTGTLTIGKFEVVRIKSLLTTYDDKEIIRLAAALEQNSEHPIATGILSKAKELSATIPQTNDFKAITGKGVEAGVVR